MFTQDDFGKPISDTLSDFLKAYTDHNDRANVSANTGIGTSTLRDVTFRYNALTENNSAGVLELIKLADKKCSEIISNANEAKKYFQQYEMAS